MNTSQVQGYNPQYLYSRQLWRRKALSKCYAIRNPSHLVHISFQNCIPWDEYQTTHNSVPQKFIIKGTRALVKLAKILRSIKMQKAKLKVTFPSDLYESLPSPLCSLASSVYEIQYFADDKYSEIKVSQYSYEVEKHYYYYYHCLVNGNPE